VTSSGQLKTDPRATGLARALQLITKAATENWGTKILAFLLALVVFIVTRDEVTRDFTIPLRIIEDPDRVLLTEPPTTVGVRLRGPWANVNRLSSEMLGAATLDLREVRPGPMTLDPGSVVMPPGVVLDTLEYDPIDLRFEDVVERGFSITPIVIGEVDADHQLVASRVEPSSWPVRGPVSAIEEFERLRTEPVDIDGIRENLDLRVELERLPPELEYMQVASHERPKVRFVAEVTPISGEIELTVSTGEAWREALPKADEIELPDSEKISIKGPKPTLREIRALDTPVIPVVEVDRPSVKGGPLPITLRFEWSAEVPESTRTQLSIVPPLIRLRLSDTGLELPADER
jgi:YbbR domain-containing protein